MDSHVEELIEFKERCKSNTKRIDELTIAVREMATEMKHLREEQANMNDRLKIIEDKPSKNWEKIITTIIGTVVGAIIGLILK